MGSSCGRSAGTPCLDSCQSAESKCLRSCGSSGFFLSSPPYLARSSASCSASLSSAAVGCLAPGCEREGMWRGREGCQAGAGCRGRRVWRQCRRRKAGPLKRSLGAGAGPGAPAQGLLITDCLPATCWGGLASARKRVRSVGRGGWGGEQLRATAGSRSSCVETAGSSKACCLCRARSHGRQVCSCAHQPTPRLNSSRTGEPPSS